MCACHPAEGRADPVPIQVPTDRSGLGLSAARRERRAVMERLSANCNNHFRSRMADKFHHSRVRRQLEAARRICVKLDTDASIDRPASPSFWPPIEEQEGGEDEQRADRQRSPNRSDRHKVSRSSRLEDGQASQKGDSASTLVHDLADPCLSDDEDFTRLDADRRAHREFDVCCTVLFDQLPHCNTLAYFLLVGISFCSQRSSTFSSR